jgi:short-subunit dehydrogenase
MKNQHSVILSISSDIGFEIAKSWIGKKKIIGTYLTNSKKIEYLKYKVNFKKKVSVDKFCKKISSNKITSIISAVGTQNPISKFQKVDFDVWTDSILINAINQIRCVVNLAKKRRGLMKVILFAGGGTNNATESYSAYTLSKIMLIKFSELLDYEMKNVSCCIIGPGFVKTKIHDATISNKVGAGDHYKRTIDRFDSINCVPIHKVVECVDWVLSQSKKIVGGRNISLVYDDWGSKKLNNLLLKNTNIYKLRRFGNDKLIRKKIINLKNYNE